MPHRTRNEEGIRIELNGEARAIEMGATVASLVAAAVRGAPPEGVAVAVNGDVVPRAQWHERKMQDGDRVEIVRAVAGG